MVTINTGIAVIRVESASVVYRREFVWFPLNGEGNEVILTDLKLGTPINETIFFPFWFEITGQIGIEKG